MSKELPSQQYLSECFEYSDGKLFWKARPESHFNSRRTANMWNAKFAGTVAGRQMPTARYGLRYIQIGVDNKRYLAHRLILALHGIAVPDVVDHINGNPADNRIENLEPVTHLENVRRGRRCKKTAADRGVDLGVAA